MLKILLGGALFASAAFLSVSLPTEAGAHEGETDGLGCHYARNHRNYHCHEGAMEGMTFQSKGEAMRNWNRLKNIATQDYEDDDDDDGL